jgi:hypothetical protein
VWFTEHRPVCRGSTLDPYQRDRQLPPAGASDSRLANASDGAKSSDQSELNAQWTQRTIVCFAVRIVSIPIKSDRLTLRRFDGLLDISGTFKSKLILLHNYAVMWANYYLIPDHGRANKGR